MATLTLSFSNDGIYRQSASGSLAINATIGDCDVLNMKTIADAAILIPASVTSVTFWGCDTVEGTYKAIYGSDVAAATLAVTADRWYTFPAAVFPHSYVKIVSAGANGTATIVAKT